MEYKEYHAACVATSQKPMQLSDFSIYPEEDRVSKFALHRIDTVIKADNLTADNGKPFVKNWKNRKQWSWGSWYWVNDDDTRPSGVGFRFHGTHGDGTLTRLGSRLGCFSEERVRTILNTPEMIETYNEYMGV